MVEQRIHKPRVWGSNPRAATTPLPSRAGTMPPVRDLTSSLLLEHVGRNLQRRCGVRHGDHLVAGVSGGADSVALLRLLIALAPRLRLGLVVAHFDHGIHPASGRVAEAVRALAASYRLACEEGRGELGAAAGETLARASRYTWLETTRVRLGAAFVFTAHHADDQVETVLMRALRGSGPAGLAGMAARRGTSSLFLDM